MIYLRKLVSNDPSPQTRLQVSSLSAGKDFDDGVTSALVDFIWNPVSIQLFFALRDRLDSEIFAKP